MLVFWILVLAIMIVVWKVAVYAIKRHIRNMFGVPVEHQEANETMNTNSGEVIEMVERNGVWEISAKE